MRRPALCLLVAASLTASAPVFAGRSASPRLGTALRTSTRVEARSAPSVSMFRRGWVPAGFRLTKKSAPDQERATLGERAADKVASAAGSWRFIFVASTAMAAWLAYNGMVPHPFDAPPFVGLNLVLSTVAALQAPFILMSQNRQGAQDRKRLEADFQLNLKAEAEITELHAKVDTLTLAIEQLTLAQREAQAAKR